ncbi:hypothetical protein [Kitasatospora sp. DSM 101779]|nr:hypothetical protein [Kitasatospora sp. DSM 101779]MCU7823285.1 hypothetical protein [Kitasatospora sp. DSM 101779]
MTTAGAALQAGSSTPLAPRRACTPRAVAGPRACRACGCTGAARLS